MHRAYEQAGNDGKFENFCIVFCDFLTNKKMFSYCAMAKRGDCYKFVVHFWREKTTMRTI